MSQQTSFRADVDLIALARTVLTDAGYVHELAESGDVLLAENAYAFVALTASPTISDLAIAETAVAALLQDRLAGADIGPKRWDAYLVLLSQETPHEQGEGVHWLFDINYDTRGFRRIARAGVEATIHSVRNALTPFVEPVRLEDAGLLGDSLDSLAAALTAHEIGREIATRAVDVFRQGGRLDDAL